MKTINIIIYIGISLLLGFGLSNTVMINEICKSFNAITVVDTVTYYDTITLKEIIYSEVSKTIKTPGTTYYGYAGYGNRTERIEKPKPDTNVIKIKEEDKWWEPRDRTLDTTSTHLAVHTIIFSDTLIVKTDQGDITIYSVSKK